jgi:hypothetical protein
MTDWISVADVQSFIGSDVTDDTAQQLADSATGVVRDYLQRDIAQQTFTELYDTNGTDYILLNNWPVASISSVVIDGLPPLVPAAVRQPGYRISPSSPRKLEFAGYGKQPRGIDVVTVVYIAGFPVGTAPDPLSSASFAGSGLPTGVYMALKLTVAALYNAAMADPNLQSEGVAGVFSGSFHAGGVGSVPPGAMTLLQAYRRVAP